jgi:hypothetical protein
MLISKAINNQKTDRSKTAPIETEFVLLILINFRILMFRKMKAMNKMNILIPIITIFTTTPLNPETPGFRSQPSKRSLIWSLLKELESIRRIMKSKTLMLNKINLNLNF